MNNDPKRLYSDCLGFEPFPYQERLAATEISSWPDLLEVPTGLGKTEAVVAGWLNQCLADPEGTPRRLVYVLPMRVLVEQTYARCAALVQAFNKSFEKNYRVAMLMGGELDRDWDRFPDRRQVLVGTQDMLVSRMLNRGYACTRFRWPVQFGLLNNDVLVALDEIQLMGASLHTARTLQDLRNHFGAFGVTKTLSVTATAFSRSGNVLGLSPEDMEFGVVKKRVRASKPLQVLDTPLCEPKTATAEALLEVSSENGLTLIVVNTVKTAQELYRRLKTLLKKRKDQAELILLHSRFRNIDRKTRIQSLLSAQGRSICISTQVIEAGVDLDADVIITEPAPWPCLVQRFGRLNRRGEKDFARAYLALPAKKSLPYEQGSVEATFKLFKDDVNDVSAASLNAVSHDSREIWPEEESGVRLIKDDLPDLFDTEPDLTGLVTDVSRFVREMDIPGVFLLWRPDDLLVENKDKDYFRREELCPVPLVEARNFLKTAKGFAWDYVDRTWRSLRWSDVKPGEVVAVPAGTGGYDPELGWSMSLKTKVLPVAVHPEGKEEGQGREDEGLADDTQNRKYKEILLAEHLRHVQAAAESISRELCLDKRTAHCIATAALWHDIGKAHPVFQERIGGCASRLLAKGNSKEIHGSGKSHDRKYFRHELVSALAWLEAGLKKARSIDDEIDDLVAYLIAAHHGKVRTALRSAPGEKRAKTLNIIKGVQEGDEIPAVELPGDAGTSPGFTIDLDLSELGYSEHWGPSWIERTQKLLEEHGPFKLAFLEAVLRAADWKASAEEEQGRYD